jgi:zinc protease
VRPSIETEEFAREREVVIEEIKQYRDSPQSDTYLTHQLSFYEGTRWGHNTLGTEESLRNMTPQMMRKYHKYYYEPNNASLVIVGGIPDIPKLIDMVETRFAAWKPLSLTAPSKFVDIGLKTGASININAGEVETIYGHISIPCNSPGLDKQNAIQSMFMHILSGTFNSRLNQALIENEQLCSSFDLDDEMTSPQNSMLFSFTTDEPSKVKKIVEVFRNTLHNLVKNPPSSVEVSSAKAVIRSAQAFGCENTTASGGWLADATFFRKPLTEIERFLDYEKTVEPEDISEYAHNLLGDIKRTTITITHPSGVIPELPTKDLLSYFSVEKPNNRTVSKNIVYEPGDIGELKNGVKIIGWQIPESEVLSIKVFSNYNILNEPIAGISNVTSKVILKGTDRKTASDISAILEGIGGSLGSIFGSTYIGLDMNLLFTDRRIAFSLIPEIMAHAAFKDSEIEKAVWDSETKLTKLRDSNNAVAFDRFCSEFLLGTPMSVQPLGTEKSLKKINRKNVVKYYNSLISTKNLNIVVAGNFNGDDIIECLNTEFSKYTINSTASEISIGGKFSGNKRRVDIDMNKEQSAIIIGFPTCGLGDDDVVYWQLFNVILGRSPNSRLFSRLRDKYSLAYSVSSTYVAQLNMGYIAVLILTSNDKTDTAWDGVFSEIDDLICKRATKQEFKAAQTFIVEQMKNSLETTSGKAGDVARSIISGLPPNDTKQRIARINSVQYDEFLSFLNRTTIDDWGGVVVGKL